MSPTTERREQTGYRSTRLVPAARCRRWPRRRSPPAGFPAGVAVLPDQGPVAAFSATTGQANTATSFNASASSDPDGSVALYAWSFGDGGIRDGACRRWSAMSTPRRGPTAARLTVTDDAGCSTALVFTGQTASCNGGPQAQMSHRLRSRQRHRRRSSPRRELRSARRQRGQYTRGQVVPAGYACQEGADGPGIASCEGSVPSGRPIDTSRPGRHSFTVTATSADGQKSTGTVTTRCRPATVSRFANKATATGSSPFRSRFRALARSTYSRPPGIPISPAPQSSSPPRTGLCSPGPTGSHAGRPRSTSESVPTRAADGSCITTPSRLC